MISEKKSDPLHLVPTPAACLFALVAFLILIPFADSILNGYADVGRHVRIGQYILEHARFPRFDVFSNSMYGRELIPSEWLSEVLFALVVGAYGIPGLTIVTAVVIASTFVLLYRFVQRVSDPWLGLLTVIVALPFTAIHWSARPHIFTFLGAILLLYQLERTDRASLALTGALFVLWANAHGGFLYGLVTIWVCIFADVVEYAIQRNRLSLERAKHHALLFGCALLGSAINPVGFRLHIHLLGYFRNAYLLDHTVEYMSPDFHATYALAFLIVLLSILGSMALSTRQIPLLTLALVVVNVYFALFSARNIPLFALTALPLIVRHFVPDWNRSNWRLVRGPRTALEFGNRAGSTLPWLAITVVALMFVGARHGTLLGREVTPRSFNHSAQSAVDSARTGHLSGTIFNKLEWGGFLLYAWPEQKVFIDGQTDFYGEDLTKTHDRIVGLQPGWRAALDETGADIVLMPAHSKLALALSEDDRWRVWYRDTLATIIVRPNAR